MHHRSQGGAEVRANSVMIIIVYILYGTCILFIDLYSYIIAGS